MNRIKKPRDWTLRDFTDYVQGRVCDGHWSVEMAMYFIDVYKSMPRFFKRKWWEKNKTIILNCESEYTIDINTGSIYSPCPDKIEKD